LEDVLQEFLQEISPENYPEIGIVGIAGPVVENKCHLTNIPHWPVADGNQIGNKFKMDFLFVNDFTVASYGVSTLTRKDYSILGSSNEAHIEEGENSMKIVIGPGTGLGVGVLAKNKASDLYQPIQSEGGHVDFVVQNEDDFELYKFVFDYIENSNNVENLRAKGKIERVSVERLCAGPAIPLLYAFMKKKHPEVESTLEKQKVFEDITAKDIISHGLNNHDPLCMLTINRFLHIFGVAVGNNVLRTLPYGGVYLIGGVVGGLHDYLLRESHIFMEGFYNKGRLSDLMRQFPVFVVNPEVSVGLLGAEEMARRMILKKQELKEK
jgi:glucokinase